MRHDGNGDVVCKKGKVKESQTGEVKQVDRHINKIAGVLRKGLDGGVYPGAVALVGREGKIIFCEHVGHRALIPEPVPMAKDTIFDLASLTKVMATTPAIMKLVDEREIALDEPLSKLIASANLGDKKELTPRLLLNHSAGLMDWRPFYEKLVDFPLKDRKRVLREWIIEEPFAYEPGKGSLYSDLGFMLLEWVIEERAGESLPGFVERHFYGPLGLKRTFFMETSEVENPPRPSSIKGGRIPSQEFAATEDCPWRNKVLQGEVHDDNAWAVGGCSGHAGLFSDAEGVYAIANMLREHHYGMRRDFFRPETAREFFKRQDIVKGSDWALGWDTRALEGSSAGKHFSRDSVGHTGFTGTSLWMDLEKDVIAVFLTNRVHPRRDNGKIKQFRPVFHDAVMEALGLDN
jgi:CubicO group peptidase (beta-lactamase class C family)